MIKQTSKIVDTLNCCEIKNSWKLFRCFGTFQVHALSPGICVVLSQNHKQIIRKWLHSIVSPNWQLIIHVLIKLPVWHLLPCHPPKGLVPHDDMETLSALLALCEGNPPVTGGFPSQRSSNADLWCFLGCYPEQAVQQTLDLSVIWDDFTLMWRYWMKCHIHVTPGKRQYKLYKIPTYFISPPKQIKR